jgi:hypothetical protein
MSDAIEGGFSRAKDLTRGAANGLKTKLTYCLNIHPTPPELGAGACGAFELSAVKSN